MDLSRLFKTPRSFFAARAVAPVFQASLLCALSSGCLDMASNYGDVLPPVEDMPTSPPPPTTDPTTPPPTTDPTTPPPTTDPTGPSAIAGTAASAGCSSYQQAENGSCAGYYCGVSIEMIEAELTGTGKCKPTPDDVCSGRVTFAVSSCARSVKSNPLNAFDSDAQLRVKIEECVRKDPAITSPAECLGCFLDAAECASKNCLSQCLTGDSTTCDSCRMQNGCNQSVPVCGGLPSPF